MRIVVLIDHPHMSIIYGSYLEMEGPRPYRSIESDRRDVRIDFLSLAIESLSI
jgi:hypothetical protein